MPYICQVKQKQNTMKTKTQLSNEEMFSQLLERNGNSTWHVSNNNDIVNSQSRRFGLNLSVDCGIVIKSSRGWYSIPEKSVPTKMAEILREHSRVNSLERNKRLRQKDAPSIPFPSELKIIATTLEECIFHVKAAGLKVMKAITEYKEI